MIETSSRNSTYSSPIWFQYFENIFVYVHLIYDIIYDYVSICVL